MSQRVDADANVGLQQRRIPAGRSSIALKLLGICGHLRHVPSEVAERKHFRMLLVALLAVKYISL